MSSVLKFASFLLKPTAFTPPLPVIRVGLVLDGGSIVDLTRDLPGLRPVQSMQELITLGTAYQATLKELGVNAHGGKYATAALSADDVQLLAPLPRPSRNVFCVGRNYLDHIAEVRAKDSQSSSNPISPPDLPKYPQFFTKSPDSVIGPNAGIQSHSRITKYLDYEAELAVVIGKNGRDIPAASAMDHVFGYTIGNDVTARDVQRKHGQWFKGKTLDTTCPLGPYIVPRDEVRNVRDLSLKLWLNGALMQNGNTSNMLFDIPAIISNLSEGFTLREGDVILTGTPEGVGYTRQPPVCLKEGDKIKIAIQDIGELENHVVA